MLKVISYNVKGIPNPIKRSKILTKMRREISNILFFCVFCFVCFLQETHLTDQGHLKLKRQGYNQVGVFLHRMSQGVG